MGDRAGITLVGYRLYWFTFAVKGSNCSVKQTRPKVKVEVKER
jgi:hypothetical protein